MKKTISVNGYEFTVEFDYQPYEKSTRYYPGTSEAVEIQEVWDSDNDKLKDYAFDELQNELEEACINAVCIDQEEAKLAKEEAKQEAREARWELNQWE